MATLRLLLALLLVASGITAALFVLDSYLPSRVTFSPPSTAAASLSVAKPQLPAMKPRTRFVAVDDKPAARPAKTQPAAAPVPKKQAVKAKDRPPQQAATQSFWGLFSN